MKSYGTITNPDDTDLVQKTRQDPEKFDELYMRYVKRIFRYLYGRVGNVQEAEDLTAQTFLSALESIHRFREDGCFAAWLFTIARNKTVDHFRRKGKTDALDEDEHPQVDNDPLTGIIRSERVVALSELIRKLPEQERELLRLRYVAEMSFGDMTRLLKRNEDAIKKSLYRLLQRLQGQLESSND